jgi:D-alanyl-lipoteichoic acid acyltransferase DltB (MBOAT superfamily)
MNFNSLHFALYFPVVVLLYFALPHRHRWGLLLAASYYFYGCWRPEYLLLLMASTGVDYVAGRGMADASAPGRKRAWLMLSLAANMGMLAYFKYTGFFFDSLRALLLPLGVALQDSPAFHPLLPVGISFYTFQSLAYTIDVYRGLPPERHLGKFALYVSFFPQLVAGPIERAKTLLPQFDRVHTFHGGRVVSGLTRMAWGFFMKLVIADRIAPLVDQVYGGTGPQSAGAVLLATYAFYFQIYADFSGYASIAIGSARVMGFELMENFNRPLMATSVDDLWRRWHISLLTWFRDYLFRPLGWSRPGRVKWARNIMIVFLASGLWHGASWTFVAFGAVNGAMLVFGVRTRRWRERRWEALQAWVGASSPRAARAVERARPWVARLVVFHLMVASLVLFRAPTLERALQLYGAFVRGLGALVPAAPPALSGYELALAGAAVALFVGLELFGRRLGGDAGLAARPRWVRWSAFYALALGTVMFGEVGSEAFYYFQF